MKRRKPDSVGPSESSPFSVPHALIWLRARDDVLHVAQGRTGLILSRAGWIEDPSQGLFVHETRLLSRYRYLINGAVFRPVTLSNVEQHSWLGYYIALPPGLRWERDTGSGQIAPESQQTLELKVSRFVGEGFHEDIDLTSYTQQPVAFNLDLEIDGDFADLEEAGRDRQQSGDRTYTWLERSDGIWQLRIDYRASHRFANQNERGTASVHRAAVIEFEHVSSLPQFLNNGVRFEIFLPPRAHWHTCVNVYAEIDGTRLPLEYRCHPFTERQGEYDQRRLLFLRRTSTFSSPESRTLTPLVIGTLERARLDLSSLRLFDLDRDQTAWTMAAGFPMYVALFGRDSLTAAWQSALLSTDPLRGATLELPRWQGREDNAWRDEQPGRMLHEAHTGPLEALNMNPRRRYYGSATTSAFFPFAISALWHWTGDRSLIAQLVEPAERAIGWLDRHGDLDGDGFYEYKTRSQQGVKHQGWKDSRDGIVYDDATEVEPPIATCEEQAFAYVAKLHFSEILWWLDRKDEARRLFREASELKKRFNDAFWMEDQQFLALGLDRDKQQIRSIASNAGHCVATGLVDSERVGPVVDRLMASDLFSGWGIRTLSANHPAYNPYSYHRGSVWPVEHGTFAIAFARYGLHEPMHRLVRAQFEAAGLFDSYRLPEAFSGHPRDGLHPFPALYPQANSPQAWSASAVFCMLQAMLGLYPYAPLNLLLLDPHLPDWLPDITLHHVRVGPATITLNFRRESTGATSYRIVDKQGTLHLLRQPSPWSLTATFAERVIDLLSSLLPHRS